MERRPRLENRMSGMVQRIEQRRTFFLKNGFLFQYTDTFPPTFHFKRIFFQKKVAKRPDLSYDKLCNRNDYDLRKEETTCV